MEEIKAKTQLFPNTMVEGAAVQPEKKEVTPAPKEKRDPAHFWLNVGIKQNGKLVTLPQGIPLDKLKPKSIPWNTKNTDFKNLRVAEADFWEQFWAFCQTLQPGDSKELNFTCEVRRVKEDELQEQAETNPYLPSKLTF